MIYNGTRYQFVVQIGSRKTTQPKYTNFVLS